MEINEGKILSEENIMLNQEGKYNMKAASQILGIQPGTLRAWERRYHVIAPVRNELGYRLYTEEQIKKLKWLMSKIDQGFTIGQAVALLENTSLNQELGENQDGRPIAAFINELLDSFLHFNELKAQDIINTLFSLFTVDKVMLEIFKPLLVQIGDLWNAGGMTSAHEHFATAIIRSRIAMIFHNFAQTSFLPKAVGVCCPGETHEIGLLMFSSYLRRKGLNVLFLGNSLDEGDLEKVVKLTHPRFLFLTCTMPENLKKSEHEQFSSFIVGETLSDWEFWLAERLG
jgi:DNA-binding transcriptional MerR regulator